eukprot:4635977-Alexandrium_andersonii.AAC.1
MVTCATCVMLASASPRKPKVRMVWIRSEASGGSVQWCRCVLDATHAESLADLQIVDFPQLGR